MSNFSMNSFNSSFIAELALETFMNLTGDLQELLLQSKNEQTFSGLLSPQLQEKVAILESHTLLELKGVDYQNFHQQSKTFRSTRNFHDIAIVDSKGKFQIIIENKVWYHFDGAKGKSEKKVEKGVFEQIESDIKKIRITLADRKLSGRGFILINLVTPNDPAVIPRSYFNAHKSAIFRTSGQLDRYRKDGVTGILSAVKSFESQLLSITHVGSTKMIGGGNSAFLDVICAEVKINE